MHVHPLCRFAVLAALGASLAIAAETPRPTVTVAALLEKAKAINTADARVPLAARNTEADANFVRALKALPNAAPAMKDLFDTIIYRGAIEPEVKLAMGLRMAQVYESRYVAAQTERRLRTTPRGAALLKAFPGVGPVPNPGTPDNMALSYAEKLSLDVHGISDADFAKVRTMYNDSQVVELTLTTCFFNYLIRYAEAFRIPVEDWAFEKHAPASSVAVPIAKVSLISDTQLEALEAVRRRAKENEKQAPQAGLGIAMANSMRAMYLSPAGASAWQAFGAAAGQYTAVDRPTKLQISFAVSTANGCRYCTLHQVLGLRRVGVDVSKLVSMQKDDSALTPKELTAVQFARKLTKAPTSVTDADYQKLKTTFGDQGAMEVVLQTCNFAFMNRFTDNLRLPSEDEAVRVYKEVYGK